MLAADLRILIVADDPLARAGLAALLSTAPGCEVVGQHTGTAEVLGELTVYQPDVVLWDLGWDAALSLEHWHQTPEQGHEEATTPLERLSDFCETNQPVVVLLPDATPATTVWLAGGRCLLRRDAPVDQILVSLTAAVQGLTVLAADLATALFPSRQLSSPPPPETLTRRELQVLQLLAEGLPNKSIAARLAISEHTVKFHVNALLGKLNAHSRTEAVVRATRLGLLLL